MKYNLTKIQIKEMIVMSPFMLAVVIGCGAVWLLTMLYEYIAFRSLQKYANFSKLRNFAYMFVTVCMIIQIAGSLFVYFVASAEIKTMLDEHWFLGMICVTTVVSIPAAVGLYLGYKTKEAFLGLFDNK